MRVERGDLVRVNIPEAWPDHLEWGTTALVTDVRGMMIKLFCESGHVKELPVQISSRYLEVIREGR